jgi:drug/metabolite transporter (DMT)-like permease
MKRSVWITFGALCLLSSNAWVAAPFSTTTVPALQRQGLLYLIIGVGALLVSGRKLPSRIRKRPWALVTLAGLGFFGIPAIAIEFASDYVGEIKRSALFAMVPIVVAVALSAIEAGGPAERSARRSLAPAIAGLGGLLLLLPLSLSNSARGNLMIAVVFAAVILAGLAGVWLYRLLQQFEPSDAVAVLCLSNAALLLICACLTGTVTWNGSSLLSLASLSSLVDVIEVLLLLWLLRRMPPVQFASRYLLIPLLTVLEAYVLVRPELTLRIGAGVILLATGAGMLLFQRLAEGGIEEESILSLR